MSDNEPADIGQSVGHAIQRARKKAGLSAVQLSDRVGELGVPIHRVALGKIETADRDVTLKELIAIATALEVAPMHLLFPNALEPVRVLPDVEMDGLGALGWFFGMGGTMRGTAIRRMFAPDDGLLIAARLIALQNDVHAREQALTAHRRDLELATDDSARELIEQSILGDEAWIERAKEVHANLLAAYRGIGRMDGDGDV